MAFNKAELTEKDRPNSLIILYIYIIANKISIEFNSKNVKERKLWKNLTIKKQKKLKNKKMSKKTHKRGYYKKN